MDWSNIDHKYKRKEEDYTPRCRRCHRQFDIKNNNYKTMTNKFQAPAFIQGISTLRDKTLKLTVYIAKELAGEEKAKLFDLEQKEGWFLFSENTFQTKTYQLKQPR